MNHLLHQTHEVQGDSPKIHDGTKSVGPPAFFDRVYSMSLRYTLDGMMWVGILISIRISLYFLREIISAFEQLSVFRKLLKLLRHAFLWTSKIISRPSGELDFSTSTRAKGTVDVIAKFCPYPKLLVLLRANPILVDRFVMRFGVHISFFSVCAAACSAQAFFFLGSPFLISLRTETKGELIVVIVVGILYVFMSAFIGGCYCLSLALSISEVLGPFFQDLNDPYRKRLILEF